MDYFDILLAKKLEDDRDPKVEGLSVSANGRYHEDGVVYDPVIVNVPETPLSKLTVTENGTYTAPSGTAYNEVEVDVPLPENAYLLKDIPNTPTAIATFSDGSDLPMPKLEVGIEPVQEGSGDPSPTNIRPIIGWDEVNVSVSGVNVWDEEWEVGTMNATGGNIAGGTDAIRVKNYIPVLPSTNYFFRIGGTNIGMNLFFYDENNQFIDRIAGSGTNNNVFTTPNNCHYIKFNLSNTYGATYNNDISINYPSTDTEYHAYNGTTYTLDLDGTRYGGKLDVVSGVMTVTHGIKVYSGNSSEGWYADGTQSGSTYRMKASDVPSNIKLPPSNTDAMSAISNQFIATSADNIFLGNEGIGIPINGGYLTIYDSVYNTNDVSLWKTHLASNPMQLVYELATPLTIQLPPTVVKSLRGMNNVWADSGNILDLSYLAKEE